MGVVLLPVYALQTPTLHPSVGLGILILLVIGELLERYLYFAAVAAPRMPGPVRT